MNPLSGYIALIVGVATLIYVCFVTYRIIREKSRIKNEKYLLLKKEGEKYFYNLCKPFLHVMPSHELLPNRYVTVFILGEFLSMYVNRNTRKRTNGCKLRIKKVEFKLLEAFYHKSHIKASIYQEGVCVAESKYSHEDFEYMLKQLMSREYLVDTSSPKGKKE